MTKAGFRRNVNAMQNNLLNFALMLTGDRENAYDLLQDTTLRALDNEDKFTDGTNIKGWLYTIMRNIFINNYHRAAYQPRTVDDINKAYASSGMIYDNVETPDSAYAVEEINREIGMLPEMLREPMLMFVRGYKYNEISDYLNIPVGTVKTHIYRARRRLQHKLQA